MHKLQTEPRDKATAARAAGGDALTAGLTHLEHLVNSALGADSQVGPAVASFCGRLCSHINSCFNCFDAVFGAEPVWAEPP